MKTRKWIAALAAVVFAAPALAADAGHHERVAVQAPSLAGNLAGDPAVRQVSIYLPPGYAKNRKARYPVLYLLHGFTDSDVNWFGLEGRKHFVRVQSSVDAAFTAGVPEMIVVMPDALTKFGGSMYSTSAVNGDWETFIASGLVAHVDAHYRTLARPESRGLAGHSMGGYGVLRVAMKRPGVFSSLYAMSPCCLSPAPFDPAMLERASKVQTVEDFSAADFLTKAMLASGAAFSPNPRKPPFYIDLPLPNEKTTPEVIAAWAAAGPLAMVHQYLPTVKSYRAIAIDSGDKDDFIAPTVVRMHEVLEGYGVAHDYEIYDGDHLNRIGQRLTTRVLPFFGKHLAFK